MDPVADLVASWREDADTLERHGRDQQANRLRRYADEVEDALRRRRSERVTVAEASDLSGYSKKHLRRMVREGRLEAERPGGEGGRILIPRHALPRKASGDAGGDDADDGSPLERHLEKVDGG